MRTSVAVRDDAYRQPMRLVEIGGRLVELHIRRSNRISGHRIVVRYGLPPELVVRPRATDAQIDEAIDFHKTWLERQLAEAIEPRVGPRRRRPDGGEGPRA